MPIKKPMVPKICPRCGKHFECWPSRADKTVYCSMACAKMPRTEKSCPKCGELFVTPNEKGKNMLYCGKKCSNAINGQFGNSNNSKLTHVASDIVSAYQSGKTAPQVAEIYGISSHAVCYRLKQAGISRRQGNRHPWSEGTREKNKTRNVGPKNHMYVEIDTDNLLKLYQEGMTALHIAEKLGVSETAVLTRLRKSGIKLHEGGYSSFRVTKDGHKVQSALEEAVDNWLYEHGIAHAIQPRCPWPAKHKSPQRADFKVGNTYIEVWGVTGNEKYKANREAKVANYLAYGANLIEIYPKQIHSDDYSPLEQLLTL